MAFYKSFQTNNNKIPITKSEARKLLAESYGERNADRHMETLLRDKVFGLSYWMLFYEPTVDTYCEDQDAHSRESPVDIIRVNVLLRNMVRRRFNMDAITQVTQYDHACNRCHKPFVSTFRGKKGLCADCKKWYKETRLTHCSKCDTKFDQMRTTKYGNEYHCSCCNSWINFGILADVFSVGGNK